MILQVDFMNANVLKLSFILIKINDAANSEVRVENW